MKKGKWLCFFFSTLLLSQNGASQTTLEAPIEIAKRIGEKLIRETTFEYQLKLKPENSLFNSLNSLDFGRSFGLGFPGIAYAYTQLFSSVDTTLIIEIGHNDACKIWCNNILAYNNRNFKEISLKHEERGVALPFSFQVKLTRGVNELLVKLETKGTQWSFFIQPPGDNDAVMSHPVNYPEIGLQHMPLIDPKLSTLSKWLIIGPFESGIDVVHEPEKYVKFGQMYKGLNNLITWTIPKIEVLGDVIASNVWGSNCLWNYHNGGVAWAMQQLSEVSHDEKYKQWSNNFCDFQMEGISFVDYQVNALMAINSANSKVIGSSLLDFTLAPSLPIIYRLRRDSDFNNRVIYEAYIERMLHYARFEQIRTKGATNYDRETPEKYTVWADDMFMGIPFLVQASEYVKDKNVKTAFLDDAASQIIDFSKHVWDNDAKLYMHANYSARPEIKLPHWSRANGWAIWAMSEVLMNLPKSHPNYHKILNQYKVLAKSIIKYQDRRTGFWRNVIDHPDSRFETSATSIFAMALARGVRYGWISKKIYMDHVLSGWKAVASQVEQDGTVHNICIGTMCSEDVNYYLNRPFIDNDTHGIFAVLFAAIEMQKLIGK